MSWQSSSLNQEWTCARETASEAHHREAACFPVMSSFSDCQEIHRPQGHRANPRTNKAEQVGRAVMRRAKLLRIVALGLVLGLIGLGGWLITIYFLTEYHLRQAERAFGRQRYPEAWEHLNRANAFRPR